MSKQKASTVRYRAVKIKNFAEKLHLRVTKDVLTDDDAIRLLELLEDHPSITDACAALGVTRTAVGRRMHAEPAFFQAVQAAREISATTRLEDEGFRRAMGWEEPIYDRDGNLKGYKKVHSDSLLILYLRAYSQRFKGLTSETQVNVNVSLGDQIARARDIIAARAPSQRARSPQVARDSPAQGAGGSEKSGQSGGDAGAVDRLALALCARGAGSGAGPMAD